MTVNSFFCDCCNDFDTEKSAFLCMGKYFYALNFIVNSVIDCFNDFDNIFSLNTITSAPLYFLIVYK